MLHGFFSSLLVIVFFLMLASCAGVDVKTQDSHIPVESVGIQKFPGWVEEGLSAGSTGKKQALQELLHQSDMLIANNLLDQASDKLERLLRIEPSYAQAWSRLSWIAMQNNRPRRTQQMAQRSNSYTHNNKLKALNWLFIREAGFQIGDEDIIRQAETMLRSLGDSVRESVGDSLNDSMGNF